MVASGGMRLRAELSYALWAWHSSCVWPARFHRALSWPAGRSLSAVSPYRCGLWWALCSPARSTPFCYIIGGSPRPASPFASRGDRVDAGLPPRIPAAVPPDLCELLDVVLCAPPRCILGGPGPRSPVRPPRRPYGQWSAAVRRFRPPSRLVRPPNPPPRRGGAPAPTPRPTTADRPGDLPHPKRPAPKKYHAPSSLIICYIWVPWPCAIRSTGPCLVPDVCCRYAGVRRVGAFGVL